MKAIIQLLKYVRYHYIQRLQHDLNTAVNNPQIPLVDFIVCGTQKGGTTALDHYLRLHPKICLPSQKELHFFDTEYHFRYPSVDYSKYHSFFPHALETQLCGEITPIYMYWYDSPRRIWLYNKKMRLIVLLRNPIDRAYSHWNMNIHKGMEELDFMDALLKETERRRDALPYQHRRYSYIDRGFYSDQLRRLWIYFPTKQVLILRSKDLKEKPNMVLHQICEFLEISPINDIKTIQIHQGEYSTPMSFKAREYLLDTYFPEILRLEQMLQWDLSDWKK